MKANLVSDDLFAEFRYEAGRNKAFVKGLARQSGFLMGGGWYGKETPLTEVKVSGYTLTGKYVTGQPGSTTKEDSGAFKAKIRSDGSLRIDYKMKSDWVSRWHGCTAEPTGNSLQPNTADAGFRHEVRLKCIGSTIEAGVTGTLGNLEVRDLGAGWEKHYALAAGGVGLTVGVSLPLPSSTSWRPVVLAPRCIDWTGTTVEILTKGLYAIVGGGSLSLVLTFKNQSKVKGATWVTKIGLAPKIELDGGSLVIGKLMGAVYSKPYIVGA